MPKKKGKAGKNRKNGKNEVTEVKRELEIKEDMQEYAVILRMLGNCRCEANCADGHKRLCHIRGALHKKVWISAGDMVLIGLRDFQDHKADIILKYFHDEARLLRAYGEVPEKFGINIFGDENSDADDDDDAGCDSLQFAEDDIGNI